jgi:hypothetical protein
LSCAAAVMQANSDFFLTLPGNAYKNIEIRHCKTENLLLMPNVELFQFLKVTFCSCAKVGETE